MVRKRKEGKLYIKKVMGNKKSKVIYLDSDSNRPIKNIL